MILPRRKPADLAALGGLAVLALLALRPATLGGGAFYDRDIHLVWHPQVETFVRALASGSWPVWDANTGFGQTLWGNPTCVPVLYPPTWAPLLMRPWVYYTVFSTGHLLFSGVGLFRLARHLGLSRGAAFTGAGLWMASIYPGDLAPLDFIDNGRDGLDTWHGWADLTGLVPELPKLGLRAELALQRNTITRVGGQRDPMRASAWMLGASWWERELPFSPKFSYHIARFSGHKPDTDEYERFDPLFWGNGLDNWWFGANGAYSWLNANLRAHRFIVDAYLSAQDIVQFQYVRASVDQTNSAVHSGRGLVSPKTQLLVGVPEPELSQEIYLQYSHVFSPNLVATAFVSYSIPGDGLEAIAPDGTQAWTTFGLGLTANY